MGPSVSAMNILRPEKLEIEGLTKVYGRRGREVTALDGIDLKVSAGEMVCIVGASGCGKSTLLSVVAGLETPTAGRVEVDGEPVVGPGPDRGMVFQGYSLFPWKTVAQNVAFGLELGRTPRAERAPRVDALLETMKLSGWTDRLPRELSGGMSQRVAIARALAPEPDILLLDEPFGALDAQTKRSLQDYLLEVWREVNPTILMVTHDVEEAVYLASRVYVMSAHPGRVAAEIAVPFGADRSRDLKRDPTFLDVCDQVQALLADEAVAA
jgi:NitT/TauT family transport system ATP-binding protein